MMIFVFLLQDELIFTVTTGWLQAQNMFEYRNSEFRYVSFVTVPRFALYNVLDHKLQDLGSNFLVRVTFRRKLSRS